VKITKLNQNQYYFIRGVHMVSHMVECPTCGRNDFESKGSMRTHHTRVHGFRESSFKSERKRFLSEEEADLSIENEETVDAFASQIEREIMFLNERFDLETEI
jgi:hypothetical protein